MLFRSFHAPRTAVFWNCQTAEVAILLPDGDFYSIPEHGDVIGHQTVEDVCKWIEFARNLVVDEVSSTEGRT